jgi:DNA invertase Pin-like site-specific DNA recombinase
VSRNRRHPRETGLTALGDQLANADGVPIDSSLPRNRCMHGIPGRHINPARNRPNRPSNVRLVLLNAMKTRFVSYLRVSTERQGRSGLGLEAQRDAVSRHVTQVDGELVQEFCEVESGRRSDRPQLAAALAACRAHRATLVIAKLDRLARNARFLLSVVEGTGDAGVVFCDLPTLPAGPVGRFMLTQMAAVAELEAGLTSQRTKAALAAAKARGVKLGNPALRAGTAEAAQAAAAVLARQARERAATVLPYIDQARKAGAVTLAELAQALTARGVSTPSGRGAWHPATVSRVLAYRTAAA